MKSKDFALIAVIAIISATLSIIISGKLFASPEDRKQRVEVIEPLHTEFNRPPKEYFNETAVNPTRIIEIGDYPESKPFGAE